MNDTMHGAEYVALTGLSAADGAPFAAVGETCERVPASSLPWLLRAGCIRRVVDAVDVPVSPERRGRARKGKE